MRGVGLALACTDRPQGKGQTEDGAVSTSTAHSEQEKAQPRPVGLGGRQACSRKRHHASGQAHCNVSQVSNGVKTASRSTSEGESTREGKHTQASEGEGHREKQGCTTEAK